MKLIHFTNLKRDLDGQMRDIAGYLGARVDEAKWPAIVEHCTFEYMKRNAAKSAPLAESCGMAARKPSSTRAPTAAGATS